jgi:hypothetical protein
MFKSYILQVWFYVCCIICDFQEEVAKEFGIPVQFQRFWLWAKRQNHTYRPNRPLTHAEETQTVNFLLAWRFSILCSPSMFRLSFFFWQLGSWFKGDMETPLCLFTIASNHLLSTFLLPGCPSWAAGRFHILGWVYS